MNANTAKIQSVIEATFISAIENLLRDDSGNFISDLYLQVDKETGEFQIYNEEEELLDKVVIFDWLNNKENETAFNRRIAATLKAVLTILSTKEYFNDSRFLRPFSVSLTNENFNVIEELLFLDDDLLRIDDPLLKDLDEELDEFLKQLLSDV